MNSMSICTGRIGHFAPVFIVEENELMNSEQIREEPVYMSSFAFPSTLEAIKWSANRRLLPNKNSCRGCQTEMSFTRNAKNHDDHIWKCKKCRKVISIRSQSFFANSHLTLAQILTIVYGWCRDISSDNLRHESKVLCPKIIPEWCKLFREVCQASLRKNPVFLGGIREDFTAKIVEVGITRFFHGKYRGQVKTGHWVLGGIERESGKCFLEIIPDTATGTIVPIIKRYILPGTIIISIAEKAFNKLGQLDGGIYEHQIPDSKKKFFDSKDNIHTWNLVKMWSRAKRNLRLQYGASELLLSTYLNEFMWRNLHKNGNIFSEFLLCLSDQYVFSNKT